MLIIDTTNEKLVQGFERKKEELDYNQRRKGFYDVNDFVMIRATDYLSEDHIQKAICKVPFVTNINDVAYGAMYDILKNKYNINIYDEKEYEKLKKEVYKYSPLSTQFRSTIHFTLNGLVSSHNMGNFDNKNFIIIDKLSNHLGKDDFRSIRMEDTFVFGEFPISNEATILIDEEKYSKLVEKYPFLDTYNIILFKGDEKIATEMFVASLNIVPEKILKDYAEYTERTRLHHSYFSTITEEYGIEEMKHCLSPEYVDDDQKNLILWKIYDTKFYTELFNFFAVNEEEKEQMINYLTTYKNYSFEQEKEEKMKSFINNVGLEKYMEFVINYNKNIMDAIEQGIYPTNEEIIEAGKIELKTDKKTL